jgi:hypothetical protein
MPDLITIKISVMKKKRIIIGAIAILFIGGGWYGYKEYTRKVPDLSRVKAEMEMNSQELISAFEKNEAAANTLYLDKIIAIEGTIKAIEKDDNGLYTVILCEESTMSSVRCTMNASHQEEVAKLSQGSKATLKGACTGFNANDLLGSDVVLNRCVID